MNLRQKPFRNTIYYLLIVYALIAFPVHASSKVALVVGNDDYQNVTNLKKAINDANTVSRTLEQLGFDVILATNTTRRNFNRNFQEFISRIEAGDIAMLYYAGHSIEIRGQNYLLPVDIPKVNQGQENFVKSESVGLQAILASLKEKKARLNIVVLDACRDNPFTNSSNRGIGGTRGLAAITPPKGTFILYSADAGEAALDALTSADGNPNSVFTRTLVPLMMKPGIDLRDMAVEVRSDVIQLAKTVSHEQTPAYYDAMIGNFYFNKADTAKKVPTKAAQQDTGEYERLFWESIRASDDIDLYQAYLEKYPNGEYTTIANLKIRKITPEPSKSTGSGQIKNEIDTPELLHNADSIIGYWEGEWILGAEVVVSSYPIKLQIEAVDGQNFNGHVISLSGSNSCNGAKFQLQQTTESEFLIQFLRKNSCDAKGVLKFDEGRLIGRLRLKGLSIKMSISKSN